MGIGSRNSCGCNAKGVPSRSTWPASTDTSNTPAISGSGGILELIRLTRYMSPTGIAMPPNKVATNTAQRLPISGCFAKLAVKVSDFVRARSGSSFGARCAVNVPVTAPFAAADVAKSIGNSLVSPSATAMQEVAELALLLTATRLERIGWADITRIVITHAHIDHYGALDVLRLRTVGRQVGQIEVLRDAQRDKRGDALLSLAHLSAQQRKLMQSQDKGEVVVPVTVTDADDLAAPLADPNVTVSVTVGNPTGGATATSTSTADVASGVPGMVFPFAGLIDAVVMVASTVSVPAPSAALVRSIVTGCASPAASMPEATGVTFLAESVKATSTTTEPKSDLGSMGLPSVRCNPS